MNTTKLTSAVEGYLADLRRIRASGAGAGERSFYSPLTNLLNAIGSMIKPKVFCVGELAGQGAGQLYLGLYAARSRHSVSMDGHGLDYVFCESLRRSPKYENFFFNQYETVRQLQVDLSPYFDFWGN